MMGAIKKFLKDSTFATAVWLCCITVLALTPIVRLLARWLFNV